MRNLILPLLLFGALLGCNQGQSDAEKRIQALEEKVQILDQKTDAVRSIIKSHQELHERQALINDKHQKLLDSIVKSLH